MVKESLQELRTQVDLARAKQKVRMEKRKLKSELFTLKNPRLVETGRAFVTGSKVAGRGLARGATAIQKFAVERQQAEQRRPRTRKVKRRKVRRSTTKRNYFQDSGLFPGDFDMGF